LKKELIVIIHNIRSAQNVGAVFRTADGLGIFKIYLSGYSPFPFDEKKDKYPTKGQKSIAKTALGAEKIVAWGKMKNIGSLIKDLKNKNYQIIGLEISPGSLDIKKFSPHFPCAMILGNEVRGIDQKILKQCDKIVHIPMQGGKESLNVSSAAAAAIYEILNK
jgi:23S rRNA (guanosine2251-2'-O)-methyltransferase